MATSGGRTVVITGASSGIGAVAARELSEAGWTVAVVGRNPERTKAVADSAGADWFLADYDRLDDVRALASTLLERYPVIDVLANNAGGLVGRRGTTADGHERTFQHNHLAPFLLTALLRKRLEDGGGRVVSTSSIANRLGHVVMDDLDRIHRPYAGGWRAYGTSKLETILFIEELARRSSLTAWSFHPGSVRSAFGTDTAAGRVLMRLAAPTQISPEAGAVPLIQLASSESIDAPSGTYFDGLKPNGATARQAGDATLAAELWEASARLVGLAG